MSRNKNSANATFTDSVINRLEEVNQHYDDTINHMHFHSYLTDVSTNEVFTFQQAMKQKDKAAFVEAMEKEIEATNLVGIGPSYTG